MKNTMQQNTSALVTVVVPVFNAEKYLQETLNSIANQSYRNLEIILIDDRSTDESLKLAKQALTKDERIRLIAKEKNEGVSAARNLAIQEATGEYICFIDSDDIVYENYVAAMVHELKRRDVDMIFGPLNQYNEIDGVFYQDGYYSNEAIQYLSHVEHFHGVDLVPQMNAVNVSPCAKLFKTHKLRETSAHFPVGVRFEDNVFFWEFVLAPSVKIALIAEPLYLYRSVRKQSASSTTSNFVDVFRVNDMVEKVLDRRGVFAVPDARRHFLLYKWAAFWAWMGGRLNALPSRRYFVEAKRNFRSVTSSREFSDLRIVAFELWILKRAPFLAQIYFCIVSDPAFWGDLHKLRSARLVRIPWDSFKLAGATVKNFVRLFVVVLPAALQSLKWKPTNE